MKKKEREEQTKKKKENNKKRVWKGGNLDDDLEEPESRKRIKEEFNLDWI